MNTERIRGMTRRRLLLGGVGLPLAAWSARTARAAPENNVDIAARPARVRLAGADGPDTDV
jgi:hypothetical protein